MSKKVNKKTKTQKMTRDQRTAYEEEIRKKQEENQRKAVRAERLKKIGIVIVCVVLVLALGIPTVALSVLSAG